MNHGLWDHIGEWIKAAWNSAGGVVVEILLAFGVLTWMMSKGSKRVYSWIDWRNRMITAKALKVGIINRDICDSINPERSLICRTHNGNGHPKPGFTVNVTIIDERLGTGKKAIQKDWQDRPLHGDAFDVVYDLIQKKEKEVIPGELDPGDYRGIFMEHNIAVACHYHIKASFVGHYFLILWFTDPYLIGSSKMKELIVTKVSSHINELKKVLL